MISFQRLIAKYRVALNTNGITFFEITFNFFSEVLMSFARTVDDRAIKFEKQRMKKIRQLKKKKDIEEKKNRQARYELRKEQIEKAKKAYANNPLTINQVKIYDDAWKRVQRSQNLSPVGVKSRTKVRSIKKRSVENDGEICKACHDDQPRESAEEQVDANNEPEDQINASVQPNKEIVVNNEPEDQVNTNVEPKEEAFVNDEPEDQVVTNNEFDEQDQEPHDEGETGEPAHLADNDNRADDEQL